MMKFEINGETYNVFEQPYLHENSEFGIHYRAVAVDELWNECIAVWIPFDYYKELTDESESCDWESPNHLTKL